MKFYIADTHFSHGGIINFDNRPFRSAEEMDKKMIDNWNGAVGRKDEVYILGDFCWRTQSYWETLLEQLNGRKHLITGNHDLDKFPAKIKSMFESVSSYRKVIDGHNKVILSHYPIIFYEENFFSNVYMLHGHVHNGREAELLKGIMQSSAPILNNYQTHMNLINVGCMLPYMDYTPRTLDEILMGWRALK